MRWSWNSDDEDAQLEKPILDCRWCGGLTSDLARHVHVCTQRPRGVS